MPEIIYRPLRQLKELTGNPRQIGKVEFEQLCQSVRDNPDYFEARPLILSDRTGELVIIAGNMRYKAARKLKLKEVPTILLAGLTEAREREIIIRDNVNNGDWDVDRLANEWSDEPLADWGVQGVEWTASADSGTGAGGDDYNAEPDEAQTRVRSGDIWRCGRHRIACIDSLDEECVKKLIGSDKPAMVWSDPPYGINIVNSGGTNADSAAAGFKNAKGKVGVTGVTPAGVYSPIVGDSTTATAKGSFIILHGLYKKAVHIWWGGNFYASGLPDSEHWIVWDKMTDPNQFADCELAWTNQVGALRTFRHQWMGMLRASEQGQKRVHPTQKPVALAEWCFTKYGKEGDTIFDPFLGSGISLIAAERLNRTLIGCELSADYINVCLSRWEVETGHTAELLERAS